MGLYDRDYARFPPPTPGGHARPTVRTALRAVSANTWIILFCVSIFLADHYLPARQIITGRVTPPDVGQLDRNTWKLERLIGEMEVSTPQPDGSYKMETWTISPVIEKSTGNRIGYAEVEVMPWLQSWLYLSTNRLVYGIEYWRLIGFQFLHANLTHLILNMVGLFIFGPIVEDYLKPKRYLAFYLLCGIFGAVMFVVLNVLGIVVEGQLGSQVRIPGLLFSDGNTPLIGASAGVFGVLVAGAYLAPDDVVYWLYIIPMRMVTLAYVLIGLALMSVIFGGNNAGGEAAHIGGAIAGYYFIRHTHHLHGFFNILGRADPTSHHYRRDRASPGARLVARRSALDAILQKVHDTGIDSLTEQEKAVLQESTRSAGGSG